MDENTTTPEIELSEPAPREESLNDVEKGAALGGLGGAAIGAVAGAAAGPVGAIVGALAGGLACAGASGVAVSALDHADHTYEEQPETAEKAIIIPPGA